MARGDESQESYQSDTVVDVVFIFGNWTYFWFCYVIYIINIELKAIIYFYLGGLFMKRMFSILIFSIMFGAMFYLFEPEIPDVIFVTIGVFIVLVAKELIVSHISN
ncbi:hypothetical protein J2S19_004418 [Metabacillus malikii]|uniref:YlaH-like protein n=2 Tax=Metabacillus malikii TaxID=1504265 RepID=A0ABT9ZMP1_9BACI|nr:hypothetical protein [Metabacillus malikii]